MKIYFGENLKALRLSKKLTQEKLAELLGVSFQSISKWERGDSFPDITIIPEIAAYFKVSVDDLLGYNIAENEKEIEEQIYQYDNLTDREKKWNLIFSLKKKYPNDFRVLLRFMSYHIAYVDKYECNSLVLSIYNNIIDNCTQDDIRICAKRYIVQHYRNISRDGKSNITFDDVDKVLATMPYMRDGKDLISCYVYPQDHPKHYAACKSALEEILGLLDLVAEHSCIWEGENYLNYNIELTSNINKIFEMFYDDNYGCQWRLVMRNYLHLGYWYSLKDDTANTIKSFKKALDIAKRFDALDEITELKSKFLYGVEFNKKELGSTFVATTSVKDWIRDRLEQFSDEIKSSKELKCIIE